MTPHLTEQERQGMADGSLPPGKRNEVTAHLATCAACNADVVRLGALLSRVQAAPVITTAPDDLWPVIRSRIERGKIVELPGAAPSSPPGASARRPNRARWIVPAASAAAIALVVLANRRTHDRSAAPAATPSDNASTMRSVADSSAQYQQQVTDLLNDLELRRAMLRPATAATIDHELQVVDKAIAELKDALVSDPNNPALRQLLATAYRQKLDILKRVGNAS
jgi:anti-sigma factor RsiW